MLQNATPLRKFSPWSPNTSTSCVPCTAPAMENVSLQILFKCPTPAIVFGNARKPLRLLTFDKVHNPFRRPRETTSERPKVLRTRQSFALLTWKCASRHNMPQRRTLFEHLNFQRCSEADVLWTFWLRNVLRATPPCTFWTSELPTMLHPSVFSHFWPPNVLRTTRACTFSTSQLPKVVRTWCVLYILTSKRASRHNGVQLFISHLARWLRTYHFSEPIFQPSGATNHWENTMHLLSSDFFSSLTFSLLLFSSLWLFPSLLFIRPYCRKFDFKTSFDNYIDISVVDTVIYEYVQRYYILGFA